MLRGLHCLILANNYNSDYWIMLHYTDNTLHLSLIQCHVTIPKLSNIYDTSKFHHNQSNDTFDFLPSCRHKNYNLHFPLLIAMFYFDLISNLVEMTLYSIWRHRTVFTDIRKLKRSSNNQMRYCPCKVFAQCMF